MDLILILVLRSARFMGNPWRDICLIVFYSSNCLCGVDKESVCCKLMIHWAVGYEVYRNRCLVAQNNNYYDTHSIILFNHCNFIVAIYDTDITVYFFVEYLPADVRKGLKRVGLPHTFVPRILLYLIILLLLEYILRPVPLHETWIIKKNRHIKSSLANKNLW